MNTALEKLFGSSARVKMIRLFLSNPENVFSLEDVSRRAKAPMPVAKREISLFKAIGLIKQRDEIIDEPVKLKDGTIKTKRPDNGRTLSVAGRAGKIKRRNDQNKKEKI